MTTTEPWASVEDVAKHLGVAKDSVYRWIEARKLPAHRIGRLWKFKLSEVDEWVRAGGAQEDELESTLAAYRAQLYEKPTRMLSLFTALDLGFEPAPRAG